MPTGKLKHPWDFTFSTKDSIAINNHSYTTDNTVFDDKFFKDAMSVFTTGKVFESTVTFCHAEIENVIFNDPATIVFWDDGTKTVVKADDEPFDKEKGLAMAISKKFYGNKGKYFNEFKKWID